MRITGTGTPHFIVLHKVKSLSRVRLFATTRTVAYQALPSMGFSRKEYWSGLPFPSPIVLHRQCIFFFFFNKLKVCDNPVLSKSISTLFPTAFDHLCLSHCGNSPNISDFFIICIMVIFDVTIVKRLQLDLLKALMMLTFFSNKVFLRYIHSLGIMLFYTLKDYKIV